MKKELKQKLKEKYKIFDTIADGNISVGDGWFEIIDEGSLLLEEYTSKYPNVKVKVAQIKEKFGEMRFYYDGSNDEYVKEIVNMMEEAANNTCERCGIYCNEKVKKTLWVKTMCNNCYDLHMVENINIIKEFANKELDDKK